MKTRSVKGEMLTTLILDIFQINEHLLKSGNQICEPFGLTSARWQVLGAINEESDPLTVSQIARRMGLARQGVQRIVNELVDEGFLESAANINHKRAPLFRLSCHGEETLAEVNAVQVGWAQQMATNINLQQVESVRKLLENIKAKLVRERSIP